MEMEMPILQQQLNQQCELHQPSTNILENLFENEYEKVEIKIKNKIQTCNLSNSFIINVTHQSTASNQNNSWLKFFNLKFDDLNKKKNQTINRF